MIVVGNTRVIGFPDGHKRRDRIGNHIHRPRCGAGVICGICCGIGEGIGANGAGIDGAAGCHCYIAISVVCCTRPGVYIGSVLYKRDGVNTIEPNNGGRVIDIGHRNSEGRSITAVGTVTGGYCDVVDIVIATVPRVFEIGRSDEGQGVPHHIEQGTVCATEPVGDVGAVDICNRNGGNGRGIFFDAEAEIGVGDLRRIVLWGDADVDPDAVGAALTIADLYGKYITAVDVGLRDVKHVSGSVVAVYPCVAAIGRGGDGPGQGIVVGGVECQGEGDRRTVFVKRDRNRGSLGDLRHLVGAVLDDFHDGRGGAVAVAVPGDDLVVEGAGRRLFMHKGRDTDRRALRITHVGFGGPLHSVLLSTGDGLPLQSVLSVDDAALYVLGLAGYCAVGCKSTINYYPAKGFCEGVSGSLRGRGILTASSTKRDSIL